MRTTPIHLHANTDGTIHDQYCRCISCKPGYTRSEMTADRLARARIGTMGLGFAFAVLIASRFL